MYSICFCFFLIIKLSFSIENLAKPHNTDTILCRNCGSDILSSEFITSKLSPKALYTFHDTLFNNHDVVVQVLPKDIFFQFAIISATHSACLGAEEWADEELWFANYRWKPCVCAECGAHIGWIFKNKNLQNSTDKFFGLILPNLIGESCK